MKKILLALIACFPAAALAGEISEPVQTQSDTVILSQNPMDENFDYPIVTDQTYPFLAERDHFPTAKNETNH